VLGAERALAFLEQARAVERQGGLMLPDGSRRRTFGGVYFRLLRDGVTSNQRWQIFAPLPQPTTAPRAAAAGTRPAPLNDAWFRDDYAAAVAEAEEQLGEARTVKATVMGRPAKVVTRDGAVLVGVSSKAPTAFPKGVPTPTAVSTKYMLIVSQKQWNKVAQTLQNPDDVLIAEGYGTLDPRFPSGITVHCTTVTTKLQQQAKRQAGGA
jgi:hypothetical protein